MKSALRLLDIRFVRFLMVGALNTAFGYALFALLLFIGLHYALAVLLGTIISVLFNFKTTGRLVFQSRDNRLIFQFFAVYFIIFISNVAGLRLLTGIGLSPYYGGAILILPMAVLGYLLNKTYVFKK